MTSRVELRPARANDREFLRDVYAGTRADELAQVDWSEAQKRAFVHMQFEAQRTYYDKTFPRADFQVIVVDGAPAGRLYLDRRPDEIRVIDIALLPAHRGAGIGGRLMAEILAEAQEHGKLVRIHVEQFNPALRLYQRLGFERIEVQGIYYLMEWRAAGRP